MTPEQREHLGRIVREEWVKWAKEQPNPKPSWLVEWEGLGEPDKEVDRRIGARIWNEAIAAEREACAGVAEKNLETAEAILGGSNQFLRLQAAQTAYLCKIIAKEIRARSEGDSGDKNQ